MTSDAIRAGFETKAFDAAFPASKLRVRPILTFIGYVGVFVGYMIIFMASLLTVGFLEIRQANMSDFNALIAMLEQRDNYPNHHLDAALDRFAAEGDAYRSRIRQQLDSLVCFDIAGTTVASESEAGNAEASSTSPKTCAEIKETLQRRANELNLTESSERFKWANLALFYEQYVNGITQKSPKIIFVLRILDSKSTLLTWWARSPFELVQMFLLVCMGLLGGVISVMRCFVDPKLKSPAIAEFFYKPAAGAAISLGVYVLFRAAQIFLGVQNQGGAATVSTSVFLLAGLGLASGFCATQALATIESVATRLLRSAGETRTGQADNPRGSASTPGNGPNSRPAAGGATPG